MCAALPVAAGTRHGYNVSGWASAMSQRRGGSGPPMLLGYTTGEEGPATGALLMRLVTVVLG